MVHGKTKSVDKGGDTHVRVHVPKDDWIQTPAPELQIVSPELWERVQARKAKTRARYMRASDGTLMSKPESGLAATSLLTGFLRCPCGSGMAHIRKNNRSKRYYCVERSRRGAAVCGNAAGIPMSRMDDHVLVALNDALGDEDTAWSLCQERADRWRREHVRPAAEKANAERQIKRLEAELGNLNRQARRGVDIDVQEFNGTKSQIAELQAKLAGPGEVQFDREALRVGLATVRQFHRGHVRHIDNPEADHVVIESDPIVGPLAVAGDPAGVRSALRKLGVERIICKPVTDGWDFEGIVNLARLVSNSGTTAGPVEAPHV